MSCNAPTCPHCHGPTRYVDVKHDGPPEAFTVVWRCDGCSGTIWEIAGLCTAIPKPGDCLACGAPARAGGRCHSCGLRLAPIMAQIGARCGSPPDPQKILDLCEAGLFHLALCAVNLRLAADPEDVAALQTKGKVYGELERNDLAVPLLARAMTLGADDGLLIDLGVALANSGRVDEAEATYRRYLEAHPEGEGAAVVLSNLGGLASGRGWVDEGEALHRQAVAMDPDNAHIRWNLLANLLRKRRYDDGLRVIDEAMAAAPPEVEAEFRHNALCYRAEVLMQLRRFAEALADVDESLAAEADSVDRMLLRARALIGLGRVAEAELQLMVMLEQVPHSPTVLRMLERLREGQDRVVH